MRMIKPSQLLPAILPVLFFSCASNEIGQSKDVSPETVYQQYRFDYDEQNKTAGLVAQFRFAGENGTTLILSEPSKFEFDGRELKVDSNSFSGAFYESSVPTDKVIGKHTMVFTDIYKTRYENSFTIDSFSLVDVPEKAGRQSPIMIKFKAAPLGADDVIELQSQGTDSSFSVSYTAGQTEGYIMIPVKELARQKQDELIISATLNRALPLQRQVKEGGKISISHTLKPVKIVLQKETS